MEEDLPQTILCEKSSVPFLEKPVVVISIQRNRQGLPIQKIKEGWRGNLQIQVVAYFAGSELKYCMSNNYIVCPLFHFPYPNASDKIFGETRD